MDIFVEAQKKFPIYLTTDVPEYLNANADLKLTVRKIVGVDHASADVLVGKINPKALYSDTTSFYTSLITVSTPSQTQTLTNGLNTLLTFNVMAHSNPVDLQAGSFNIKYSTSTSINNFQLIDLETGEEQKFVSAGGGPGYGGLGFTFDTMVTDGMTKSFVLQADVSTTDSNAYIVTDLTSMFATDFDNGEQTAVAGLPVSNTLLAI